jgi:nucleoside-diphosphate-sugar epimerase
MRIFVAGATGVLGRRVVDRLVARGHDVTGIARTHEKAAELSAAGAHPVTVSLFDAEALTRAVAGHDAVVNLATKIPPLRAAARPSAWDENTRIRTVGSKHLVDAAIAAGASVYVQESLAFLYGEHGDVWVDAGNTPIAESPFTQPVRVAEAQVARFADAGGRAVALRFGVFQAAESHHAASIFNAARRGILLEPAPPDAYLPTIDADDAAAAVVAAVEGAPSGAYDIVDDEPLRRRDYAAALAAAVGRRRLHRIPGTARAAAKMAGPLAQSQRVSNRRFRDATEWRPAIHDQAAAVEKIAAVRFRDVPFGPWARLVLWLLAAFGLGLAVYALFFPTAFYDDFPFGRGWVAHDGPFNEHLIRDFGALQAALAAVTLVALYTASRTAARAAAVGWLVFSVPHALYHFRNLEHYDTGDQIANIVTLTGAVALAVIALVLLARPPAARPRRPRSYSGGGEPVPQPAAAGLRHDDLRGDVGARGRDGIDQPRTRVP